VHAKAIVNFKDKVPDEKDLFTWKWLYGAATSQSEFGDPTTDEFYELCIYDGTGLVMSATAPPGGLCNGKPCWTEKLFSFKYSNKTLTPDGLLLIFLKEGAAGSAKISVKGKGLRLDMPDLATLVSPMTVQLKNSNTCWGAVYSFPPAVKNDAANFKDRAD
jgi:hypothetical protein